MPGSQHTDLLRQAQHGLPGKYNIDNKQPHVNPIFPLECQQDPLLPHPQQAVQARDQAAV